MVEVRMTEEAWETLRMMGEWCLDYGIGMGQREGWVYRHTKSGNLVRVRKQRFRKEIERVIEYKQP
jgi:hypothetical protein